QAGLTGDADGDLVVFDLVAGEELLQRLLDERVRIGVRLREDFRVLDVVERGGGRLAVDHLQAEGLEGALTDVDAPNTFCDWHGRVSPGATNERPGFQDSGATVAVRGMLRASFS